MKITFKVPKFHLATHCLPCLARFSLNYTPGAGKTDGEGIERNWSWLNGCARSLSMMTAGARWDTMDDFANYWNWRKTIGLETSLVRKMVKVIPEAMVNAWAYVAFTKALQIDHAEDVKLWQDQVLKWETNQSNFCPYNVNDDTLTLAKVKKDLADEEHQRELDGANTLATTASGLIIEGLEIEELQRTLTTTATRKKLTEYQQTALQKTRTSLLGKIRRFRVVLFQYMPGVRRLLETDPITHETRPENLKLFLPSNLNFSTRVAICLPGITDIEDRLRYAQAFDSLSQLHSQLRARSVAYKNGSRLIPSQAMYTKLHALQDNLEVKIKAISDTYRAARSALLSLRGEGPWTLLLRELHPRDIRGITERVVQEIEKADLRRAQEMAGFTTDEINAVLKGITSRLFL
ncbi:hypothetical protein E1B28_003218 [Marasmius oreades]|uniref:Uncharacterized protein n=1 Tax=Marasmius oreades TaxID=181124 RepID=A0A9P7RM51_9AGAR|nr:uncharacterized protein E1B28_003218 [Marasmius oreades]KAG7085673.1 hypothetical protein E1B28_003218 [Marasmius oreades]